eukprot:483553_1
MFLPLNSSTKDIRHMVKKQIYLQGPDGVLLPTKPYYIKVDDRKNLINKINEKTRNWLQSNANEVKFNVSEEYIDSCRDIYCKLLEIDVSIFCVQEIVQCISEYASNIDSQKYFRCTSCNKNTSICYMCKVCPKNSYCTSCCSACKKCSKIIHCNSSFGCQFCSFISLIRN